MDIDVLWGILRPGLSERRRRYSWPPGCSFEESLHLRNHLEQCIRGDITQAGALTLMTFWKVMYWGFGRVPRAVTEEVLCDTSEEAYAALSEDRLADAM